MTERYLADYVAPMDEELSIHAPGYVDVEGGIVAAVGSASQAPPLGPKGRQHHIGGLILPGFINGHAHSPMTVLRGAGEGLPLERWLTEAIWPSEARLTPDDVRLGMQAGAVEMLLNGVTTTNEMYFFPEAVVEGAADAGIRTIVSAAVVEAPGLDRFGTPDQMIEQALDLSTAHADADMVEIGFGPHSAYTLRDETLAEIGRIAAAERMLVHIHVAETRTEGAKSARRSGASVPAHLAAIGVFEGRASAAHCVWLNDDDIGTLARHDVGVAHCPGSNGKLASGIARVADMRRAGIAVGVATDGPASNNNLDLLEEARLAVLLARLRAHDAEALGVVDALRMLTSDAARALGRPDIGSLVPGKRADLIRVSLDHLAYEPINAPLDVLGHLVWSGSARDVTDVWVGGRRIVQDGECLNQDVRSLRRRVRETAARIRA